MTYVLINGLIYTGVQILDSHAIVIDNQQIIEVCRRDEINQNIPTIDVNKALISPGFIDLQLNGCGGVMFNDNANLSTLETMHRANLRSGCTNFLPTLITSSDEEIRAAVHAVKSYHADFPNQILGLHLEGPFISEAKKGIHNSDFIRHAEHDIIDFILDNKSWIRKITLAPEENPSLIKIFSAAGIVVSVGHSNATYQQAKQAFADGASCATHLFNAMSQWSGREPGVVGAIFDTPEVYAGIIADGFHVDYASIRISHKIKGNRLILVTDATAPAGLDIDSFIFVGKKVYYRDGKCVDENGTLGGSALTMIEAVKNTVNHVGLPLDEALRMATLYPATAIGVDQHFGTIEAGKIANLVIFDNNFNVLATVVNGQYEQIIQ
jgi:N-acetylglucosamine-6-phosphate deacetylase